MVDGSTQAPQSGHEGGGEPGGASAQPKPENLLADKPADTAGQEKAADPAEAPKPEEKPAEKEADPASEVPEKYEFKTPEGVTLDETVVAAFSETAKSLKLTQAQAQVLVDFQVSRDTQAQKAYIDTVNGWAATARKDAEIGGAKFDENLGVAKKALDAYGTPALKEWLNTYGTGNHPELLRLLVNVGKTLGEGSFHSGNGDAGHAVQRNAADVLFPNTLKK